MKSRSYYRVLTDADNNFASDKTYFQVNCTGHSYFSGEVRASASRHDYYLIYLCSGTVYIHEPRLDKPLEAGNLIIFQPEHHFDYYKPSGDDMEYFWVHFTGYGAPEFLKHCELTTNRILNVGLQTSVCDDFRMLFEPFLPRDRLFDAESHSRLSVILTDLAKCLYHNTDSSLPASKINKSLSYIHRHLSQTIQVESLAAAEHMSSSRFRAVFREVTGLSPQEYIILTKLKYACELMQQTGLSLKEVGAEVGYADPQYFSRIFRHYFGMSPGNYKKINSRTV